MFTKYTATLLAPFVLMTGDALAATPIAGATDFGTGTELLASGSANDAGLSAQDVFGWDFNLVLETPETVGLHIGDLAWGSGSGLQYFPSSSLPVSLVYLSVKSNGGEYFDLQGFNVSLTDIVAEASSLDLVVRGYRDGANVANYSTGISLGSGSSTALDWIGMDPSDGFLGIDEFRIMPGEGSQIGYLGIDNLTAVNFVPEPSSVMLAGLLGVLSIARRRR